MTPSLSRVLFGTDELVPESYSLRAGPLALVLRSGVLVHLGISGPGGASITDIADGDLREGLCPCGVQ